LELDRWSHKVDVAKIRPRRDDVLVFRTRTVDGSWERDDMIKTLKRSLPKGTRFVLMSSNVDLTIINRFKITETE
jgi:hypothetical protein